MAKVHVQRCEAQVKAWVLLPRHSLKYAGMNMGWTASAVRGSVCTGGGGGSGGGGGRSSSKVTGVLSHLDLPHPSPPLPLPPRALPHLPPRLLTFVIFSFVSVKTCFLL